MCVGSAPLRGVSRRGPSGGRWRASVRGGGRQRRGVGSLKCVSQLNGKKLHQSAFCEPSHHHAESMEARVEQTLIKRYSCATGAREDWSQLQQIVSSRKFSLATMRLNATYATDAGIDVRGGISLLAYDRTCTPSLKLMRRLPEMRPTERQPLSRSNAFHVRALASKCTTRGPFQQPSQVF
jgi:hypothetical protein